MSGSTISPTFLAVTLTNPLSIAGGGTGAQTPAAALQAFGGAALAGTSEQTFSVGFPLEANHAMPWTNAPVNIWWYGAIGNGIADDTAAINAAIIAANGAGVYFPQPPVSYKVSSPLIFSVAQRYFGSGLSPVIISTNSATADIVQVTGSHVTIDGLCLTSSVTKTAGISLNISGSYVDAEKCLITQFFTGVQIGQATNTATIRIRNCTIAHSTANGTQTGVSIANGVDVVVENTLITGQPNANLAYGILVTNVGDATLKHVQVIFGGDGITVAPQSGQVVQALFISDSFSDTCSGAGIYVAPTNGVVQLMKLTAVWSCSHGANSLTLTTSGTGSIQQFDAVTSTFSNSTGDGVSLSGTGIAHSTFVACSMSANTRNGFEAGSGVVNFKLIGCTIGQSGEFAGNTLEGIVLNGANDGFSIVDNQVINNGSGAMTFGGSSGGPGITYFVARNDGILTNNYGELITTAGPTSFTVTHGLAFTPGYEDITLTPGTGLGNATSFWLSAVTAATFTITFNAAPGATVGIFWRARIMGS